jgi:hypothetical protein
LKGKITIHYGNQENCNQKGNQEVGCKEDCFEERSEKDDSEEEHRQEGNQEILRREEIYKVSAAARGLQ